MGFPRGQTRTATGGATGGGGGGGGGRGMGGGPFGGSTRDFTPIPKERRARTLRRIVGLLRALPAPGRHRPRSAILATSIIGLINPLLLGLLLDQVIIGEDYAKLNLYVGLMIVLPIITGLIGVGQSYLNNVIGQNVMQDLRGALYAHLQSMPLRFFTETRTGEIQSRLANDIGGVQAVVTDTASSVTSNLAIAISTTIAMFLLDWRLALLSLGLTPFFLYLTYRVGKVRREVSTETQKSLAEMTATTEETLSVSGILLSKTFGQQANAIEKFRGQNRRLAKLQIRQAMVGRWFFMIIGSIFSIMPAFVYWLAGTLAANGSPDAPSAGTIVAFTTLQSRLFFPLGQLLNIQVEIQGSLALFDRIFEYLEMDPEIVDAPDAVAMHPATTRGKVRFRDVSFQYPTAAVPSQRAHDAVARGPRRASRELGARDPSGGRAEAPPWPERRARTPTLEPAASAFSLEHIDFEAEPGQLVALVGPSGAGKTTTTYLVSRLYDVDSGAVEIDDVDVRRIKLASLGRDHRRGDPGDLPVPRLGPRQPPLRQARGDRGRAHRRRDGRLDPRAGHGAPRGLRHDRRRARLQAVGWREAAAGDRPGPAQGPADPDPRRGDLGARHRLGAAHPARLRAPDGGPDDDRHRPSAVDDPAGRPDHRVRPRCQIAERGTHAELLALDGLYARLYRSSSWPRRPADWATVDDEPTLDRAGRSLNRCPPSSRSSSSTHGGMLFAAMSELRARATPSTTGQSNRGGSPVETILAALGGVQRDGRRLDRRRRSASPIDEYRIHVRGSQRDEYPQVFTEIVGHPRGRSGATSPRRRSGAASSCRPRSTARSTR